MSDTLVALATLHADIERMRNAMAAYFIGLCFLIFVLGLSVIGNGRDTQ